MPAGSSRTDCWIGLDKDLMENVVPWVPYLWRRAVTLVAPSVTHYVYDQNSNLISWSRPRGGAEPGSEPSS